uniref:Uncharacterized protein n=1 Tax=Cacopsylla melanoneura TaxID=428564 RepID=A0A8D9BIP7_9HEMI
MSVVSPSISGLSGVICSGTEIMDSKNPASRKFGFLRRISSPSSLSLSSPSKLHREGRRFCRCPSWNVTSYLKGMIRIGSSLKGIIWIGVGCLSVSFGSALSVFPVFAVFRLTKSRLVLFEVDFHCGVLSSQLLFEVDFLCGDLSS